MTSSTAPLLQRLESASTPPTNFVFVGNPGVGKSTLLNCLLGEVHFRSGISIGQGMTYKCDMVQIGQNKFLDTPGLADTKLREQAAEAISQALRQGGNYKVFFVIALQNGRVRAEDITTLRLVLKSAPEIGSQYAIVINQLSKGEMSKLTDPNGQDMETLQSSLMSGMEGEAKPSSFIMLNHRDDDLEDMDDAIKPVPSHLLDFVATAVPLVRVHKEKVAEVEHGQFQSLSDKVETVLDNLREQNALMAAQLRDKDTQIKVLQERQASQSVPGAVPSATDSSAASVPGASPDPAARKAAMIMAILQILYGVAIGVGGTVVGASEYPMDELLAMIVCSVLFLVLLVVVGSLGCKATTSSQPANLKKLRKRASAYLTASWCALFLGAALLATPMVISPLVDVMNPLDFIGWKATTLALFAILHPVAIAFASKFKSSVKAAAVKEANASGPSQV